MKRASPPHEPPVLPSDDDPTNRSGVPRVGLARFAGGQKGLRAGKKTMDDRREERSNGAGLGGAGNGKPSGHRKEAVLEHRSEEEKKAITIESKPLTAMFSPLPPPPPPAEKSHLLSKLLEHIGREIKGRKGNRIATEKEDKKLRHQKKRQIQGRQFTSFFLGGGVG